jgi:hypothetical protein
MNDWTDKTTFVNLIWRIITLKNICQFCLGISFYFESRIQVVLQKKNYWSSPVQSKNSPFLFVDTLPKKCYLFWTSTQFMNDFWKIGQFFKIFSELLLLLATIFCDKILEWRDATLKQFFFGKRLFRRSFG